MIKFSSIFRLIEFLPKNLQIFTKWRVAFPFSNQSQKYIFYYNLDECTLILTYQSFSCVFQKLGKIQLKMNQRKIFQNSRPLVVQISAFKFVVKSDSGKSDGSSSPGQGNNFFFFIFKIDQIMMRMREENWLYFVECGIYVINTLSHSLSLETGKSTKWIDSQIILKKKLKEKKLIPSFWTYYLYSCLW